MTRARIRPPGDAPKRIARELAADALAPLVDHWQRAVEEDYCPNCPVLLNGDERDAVAREIRAIYDRLRRGVQP